MDLQDFKRTILSVTLPPYCPTLCRWKRIGGCPGSYSCSSSYPNKDFKIRRPKSVRAAVDFFVLMIVFGCFFVRALRLRLRGFRGFRGGAPRRGGSGERGGKCATRLSGAAVKARGRLPPLT